MLLMAKSNKPQQNYKRTGVNINLWVGEDVGAALQSYLDSHRVPPKKTDVCEVALQEFLQREGYYRGKRPAAPGRAATGPRTIPAPVEFQLPVYGDISAGPPLETHQQPDEWFDFRASFARDGFYMLRVRGTSMVDEAILPGDHIVVREQPAAESGDEVVAVVDGSLTLKRLLRRTNETKLLARNKESKTQITLDPERGDRVIGVLVGVVRKK